MSRDKKYDFLVIGGGPSGHRAAIEAAEAGKSVLLVEREAAVGGECVHRGTIPSKTLRESAMYLSGLRHRSEGVFDLKILPDMKVASLMRRLKTVRSNHESYLSKQISRSGVEQICGRASFLSATEVEVAERGGSRFRVKAENIVIAVGSKPRKPPEVPVDHEIVLDSDSILSLIYLPKSLMVLGAGVIACEFASIFTSLGVEVTMIDKRDRPLAFLDPELTAGFVKDFEAEGGRFLANASVKSIQADQLGSVTVELEDGRSITTEKCLCALGRVANVTGLALDKAGIELSDRGHVPVDDHGQTKVSGIYAVGDVVGPPALAATGIMQGRFAVRHALGLPTADFPDRTPIGIYTIPEMASIGLSEEQARERHGDCLVGRAMFSEVARGHINGHTQGLLKLVSAPDHKLVGAHIIGEGATELVHVAQIAIYAGLTVEDLMENVFNFPTLAEAYHVAAHDLVSKQSYRVAA